MSDPRPCGSATVWFLNWAALVELNKCSSHDAEIETHSYDLCFSFLYLCMYLHICVGAHVCWCMYVLVCMQMCVHMCGGRGQTQVLFRCHLPCFEAGSLTGLKFMGSARSEPGLCLCLPPQGWECKYYCQAWLCII